MRWRWLFFCLSLQLGEICARIICRTQNNEESLYQHMIWPKPFVTSSLYCYSFFILKNSFSSNCTSWDWKIQVFQAFIVFIQWKRCDNSIFRSRNFGGGSKCHHINILVNRSTTRFLIISKFFKNFYRKTMHQISWEIFQKLSVR